MAKSTDYIECEGVVTRKEKGGKFTVKVDMPGETNHEAMCTISGKIIQNHIRIIVGDRVSVELSVYDLTKGRIVYRLR